MNEKVLPHILFPEIAVYIDIIYYLNVGWNFKTEAIRAWSYLDERDSFFSYGINFLNRCGTISVFYFFLISVMVIYECIFFQEFVHYTFQIINNYFFHSFTFFNDCCNYVMSPILCLILMTCKWFFFLISLHRGLSALLI